MNSTTQASECTVVIENDLDNTRRTFVLPVSPAEAEKCCLAVRRALSYADGLHCLEEYGPPEGPEGGGEPDLAAVVFRTADSIRIRWWCCGDQERAAEKLAEIQGGPQL